MKSPYLAVLPLAIALVGATGMDLLSERADTRVRITPPVIMESIQNTELSDDQEKWLEEHNPLGIPQTKVQGHRTLIVRQGYTLSHNNVDLIADWVAYHLTREFVNGEEDRPGSHAFKPDPKLHKGRRAELSDYKGLRGIFDRGHQVASGDSKGRGKDVIRESFFLSNMTPQSARLNQYRWRLLEQKIQELADERGELWVITGPAFADDDNDGLVRYIIIGENQVAVPTHYYKIIVSKSSNDDKNWEAMAFLIPNKPFEGPDKDYLRSINHIEEITGYDFFADMDDSQEEELEKESANDVWKIRG